MNTDCHLQRIPRSGNGQALKWEASYENFAIHFLGDGFSIPIFFKIRVLSVMA